METFELIMALLAAIVILVWLANRFGVPYPMMLMAGGLLLAIVPWTPTIELDPEIVLVVFLPPILFQAAQITSIRDFRANFRPISRLAVGLVVATTLVVAVVAHLVIPGISWPAAFVLGAVVSPPDAVAATAIFQRLGAPRRIVTILEGESLINDASALVVYTFAVAAVVSGEFFLPSALLQFVVVVAIGIAVGAAIGWVMGRVIMLLGDPSLSIVVMLLAPAVAYVLGERFHGSGVLAVVTAGLIHGQRASHTMSPAARVRGIAIWDVVTIAVNGLVFLLLGMELGVLWSVLSGQDAANIVWHAAVVLLAMIVTRFIYVFGDFISPRRRGGSMTLDSGYRFIIGWSGLRGVVSLAMALALPLVTDTGAPFDHRDEIILVTALVIVGSLFGLGLPLPWLLRKLNIADDDSHERERHLAHTVVRGAMFEQFRLAVQESPELAKKFQPIIAEMKARASELGSREDADRALQLREMMGPGMVAQQRAITAARQALLELRDRGEIGDEVRREIESKLDLQEVQAAF